jgi:ATP-dependent DNA helicase RecG
LENPTVESLGSIPLSNLQGVGPTRVKQLLKLGLENIEQLLDYFPRTYRTETEERLIGSLEHDLIQTVRGEVVACDYIMRGRPRFEATLQDGDHRLALTWFNGHYWQGKIVPGTLLRVRGKVKLFRGFPQIANPKTQFINDLTPTISQATYRPIYPATAGLSSEQLENLLKQTLEEYARLVPEWFDPDHLQTRHMIWRAQAYQWVHRPADAVEAAQARRRIVYDELMLLQIALMLAKRARADRISAPVVRVDQLLDQRIRARFPFPLTHAQQRVAWEILADMKQGQAMNRLVQGDVGSGKTVVALYAMLACIANKLQTAILAPTEVLAEQHYLSLSRFLSNSGVKVELFTGRTKRGSKSQLKHLADGSIHLAVGTQALLQSDIEFGNLGLVVVDEQHKLGVKQRAVLRGKGLLPHYLIMTATPIPRTLALSYFADFDVSTIDELPPGRQPIDTRRIARSDADKAWRFVKEQIALGRQAYVVVPRIDDDPTQETDKASVEKVFAHLTQGPLKDLNIAMLHGRLAPEEKQQVMSQFRDNAVQVLVATTVIEVGVDVPNATVMVIDSAEQFGLSQLHQLRGRVGRGANQSYCVLLSDAQGEDANARLNVMCQTGDGFDIAEADLQLRGPGDFFGTRQHGLPQLKVADLSQEIDMLKVCRQDAQALLDVDPQLRLPVHAALRSALLTRFGDGIGLATV